ncbi:MAG: DUF167 domain-containing protein [Candidatus Omnitrophica bacterium]|nr:DUF167 domain-containing protein [Candidatus Omnitrophota bacterium]
MRKIKVKVITGAKKEEILKLSETEYKIKVSCPPEKGKANQRIIRLLSDKFGVAKSRIRIISGKTNSRKIVEIDNG